MKYRVVKEEKFPDEFVYVPQYRMFWLWSSFVEGQGEVRQEFRSQGDAIAYLRAQVQAGRPLSKPKVVWRADDESINWRAGSDTIFRD